MPLFPLDYVERGSQSIRVTSRPTPHVLVCLYALFVDTDIPMYGPGDERGGRVPLCTQPHARSSVRTLRTNERPRKRALLRFRIDVTRSTDDLEGADNKTRTP